MASWSTRFQTRASAGGGRLSFVFVCVAGLWAGAPLLSGCAASQPRAARPTEDLPRAGSATSLRHASELAGPGIDASFAGEGVLPSQSADGPRRALGQVASVTAHTQPAVIPRGRLLAVLEAGLGTFLRAVRTSPYLERGRFVGFRIVAFELAAGPLAHGALQPGDVLLRVNGRSVERPEQALQVWTGLRAASRLELEYLRGGHARRSVYRIADSPSEAAGSTINPQAR